MPMVDLFIIYIILPFRELHHVYNSHATLSENVKSIIQKTQEM